MFERITGELVSVEAMAVVIDLHGLALRVECTPTTAASCGRPGGKATLLTQLVVGQDAQPRLFGFSSDEGRALFRLLTGVSGIGPGTALRIMTAQAEPAQIAAAIARGDEEALKVKGVGPKLAKRVVTELKDKVGTLGDGLPVARALTASGNVARPAAGAERQAEDAFLALRALEFEPDDARRLLRDARAELPATATADELVRAVLLRI